MPMHAYSYTAWYKFKLALIYWDWKKLPLGVKKKKVLSNLEENIVFYYKLKLWFDWHFFVLQAWLKLLVIFYICITVLFVLGAGVCSMANFYMCFFSHFSLYKTFDNFWHAAFVWAKLIEKKIIWTNCVSK